MDVSEHLAAILNTLPIKPGCYLMKDEAGKVIYVGKAINLRNRVRSYFHAATQQNTRTSHLVRNIRDIEWIVVGSELEALILEMNLIKKHRPHYNVRLKDDKRYPYIKVHWASPYPKVTVTRQMVQDGSRYFGPYTGVWAVHQTLDVLRRIFPYLTCDREITGQDERASAFTRGREAAVDKQLVKTRFHVVTGRLSLRAGQAPVGQLRQPTSEPCRVKRRLGARDTVNGEPA